MKVSIKIRLTKWFVLIPILLISLVLIIIFREFFIDILTRIWHVLTVTLSGLFAYIFKKNKDNKPININIPISNDNNETEVKIILNNSNIKPEIIYPDNIDFEVTLTDSNEGTTPNESNIEDLNDNDMVVFNPEPIDSINIIIDAGHGGKDVGGGGSSNSPWGHEKDINLKMGLYIENRLNEIGFNVENIRREDIYIQLTPDRINKINNSFVNEKSICISLHHNSGGGSGAEIIVSIYSDRLLARKIRDEFLAIGHKCDRKWNAESESGIQVKRHETIPNTDWYALNRLTNMETLIVEFEFVDNPNRMLVVKHAFEWESRCEAVIKALCEHTGINYIK